MRQFLSRFLFVSSIFSFAAPAGAQQPPAKPSAPAAGIVKDGLGQKLDQAVQQAADKGFSGTVLVSKGGEILLHKGYGFADREKKIPMTPEIISSIGSNTKCFTAAAILKLEQMGKLTVETPLTKFFDNVPEDKRGVTIHQLLTHSAGLLEYHDRPGEGGDFAEMTRDEAVRRIMEQKLKFAPGTGSAYSNCGYTLLAVIIEKASGQTYEQFLQEQIFKPAGLKNAGFYGDKRWSAKQVAQGSGEKTRDDNSPRNWPYTWALKGAGGIAAPVGDMYQWCEALRGETVLNAASKGKAFKVQVPSDEGPGGEGYGWLVTKSRRGTNIVNMAGGNDFGFRAVMLRDLDENALVVVHCNSGQELRELVMALTRTLFAN